jgi:RNA polymerase sigma factor (sigma-70 family)
VSATATTLARTSGRAPFQRFLDEQREPVLAFLRAMVGPQDADDCFQETFVAALRAYPRLEDGRNLRGWALRIAYCKAMDLHRARARQPVPIADPPEPSVAASDGVSDVWRAVRALPPKQRAAVAHRFVCDLPYREIGRIIDSSEAAARRSVHEGLKRMREEWDQ